MVFCPNRAQGDSPGQRPGFDGPESYQALKGRNLSERQPIRLPYPGRRFALPWAISFCPFGAGTSQTYRVGTVPGFSPQLHSQPQNRCWAHDKRVDLIWGHSVRTGIRCLNQVPVFPKLIRSQHQSLLRQAIQVFINIFWWIAKIGSLTLSG